MQYETSDSTGPVPSGNMITCGACRVTIDSEAERGVFFAAKDAVKSSLATLGNVPSTLAAILVAQFPYWLVRQPSEVLKVRRQAVGQPPSASQSVDRKALRELLGELDVRRPGAVENLFQGFGSNLAYTFPGTQSASAISYGTWLRQVWNGANCCVRGGLLSGLD